ncbi:MAG: hypothetical protein DMG41_00270 [Acidobacteria bacterium]|nr:MAG: hypothetical protein DMG41_00270 [Acidobacteriota bacterium]
MRASDDRVVRAAQLGEMVTRLFRGEVNRRLASCIPTLDELQRTNGAKFSKPTVSWAGFVTRILRIRFLELAIIHGNE